jgi:hypothetical protein
MANQIESLSVELTAGAIALAEHPTPEIAHCTGFSERSVRLWKRGRLPNEAARSALETKLGIRAGLWFIAAPAAAPARAPARVLPPEELALAKAATQEIREILASTELQLTDSARATLHEFGCDLARSILRTELPSRYAPHGLANK